MWKQLNQIIFNKSSSKSLVPVLNDDNSLNISDRKQMANYLNTYFKDVGKILNDRIGAQILPSFSSIAFNVNTILLFDAAPEEIALKINSLKNCISLKRCISALACKQHMQLLADHSCSLINQCFQSGEFPSELKLSRIIPLFKDGNPLIKSNYRPISILPVLSKIFESLLCDR